MEYVNIHDMRKVTQQIVDAFLRGQLKKVDNTFTDGVAIWLHGNKIAEKRANGLWISNAGWFSKTTKERLNGLPDVSVCQKKGEWYLNGHAWGGEWVHVDSFGVPDEPEFDLTSVWLPKKRYSAPIYAVWHSNDESTLEGVEQRLRGLEIASRRWECDTQGEYKPNYFVVVRAEDFKKALNGN
jgi:hypothetical protein